MGNGVVVQLPSKKKKTFHPDCRASIGIIAAGGKKEKPFLKAGKRFFAMKAKNKLWPKMSGSAQNAVDHPFGNKRSSRKSKARPAPRNAPPGRKLKLEEPAWGTSSVLKSRPPSAAKYGTTFFPPVQFHFSTTGLAAKP